ncbi:MAG: dTDP-4-dehydrorhamnose reductase [Fulvivirga sp.]
MFSILVTGAYGQLGSEIRQISPAYPYQFNFLDIEELNITNEVAIEEFFKSKKIDVIINCAAYTAVDKAESESDKANLINHFAVGFLAKVAKNYKIKFIHISTDYVFDGESYIPYSSSNECRPKSNYGKTKRLGEERLIKEGPNDAMIIRTGWLYSSFGNNFVKTILRLSNEKDSLNIVNDQIGCPTYALDLAKFILEILPMINWDGVKIFHYTNEGVCSWYDFAKMICQIRKNDCKIIGIPSSKYPTSAPRPFYSVLSKEETKSTFQIEIPYWLDSLNTFLKKLEK